jgi:enolase-phosphatase E1
MMRISANTHVVLDIEGTVTPVAFVHDILFPYAQRELSSFLAAQKSTSTVLHIIEQVARDAGAPSFADWCLHTWPSDSAIEWLVEVLHSWMAHDVKHTGLKALQGLIWERGYKDGTLKAPVFLDVPPSLRAWIKLGIPVSIYSSGSIAAQKLLFAYTDSGDLTSLFSHHFDTTSGPKRDRESYRTIAATLGVEPGRLLFFSDVPAELDAARDAGWKTVLVVRPGNIPVETADHPQIHSFAECEATSV